MLSSLGLLCGRGQIKGQLNCPGQMGVYLPGACIVLAFGKSIIATPIYSGAN